MRRWCGDFHAPSRQTTLDVPAFHFISGLPRSGSTLLAALLRQNPDVRANMTSPVGSLVGAVLSESSAGHESASFYTEAQREALLRGLFENYYAPLGPAGVVFDTNRGWTARLDLLARLFPDCRVICCVRDVPWILDSVERLIRKNPLELSKMFGFSATGNVYTRAEQMMNANGMVGAPLAGLKQAMHGLETRRLLLLPYDTLVSHPQVAMDSIYAFTGMNPFKHDFENVQFDATEFDARLGTPGLHEVRPQVRPAERRSILPPDVWERYASASIGQPPEAAMTPLGGATTPPALAAAG